MTILFFYMTFSRNSTTQNNITILRLKRRLWNFYKKENFKPEIKPVTENSQDEPYQLENKPAKGAKPCANISGELVLEKCSKTFSKVLEGQNLQN